MMNFYQKMIKQNNCLEFKLSKNITIKTTRNKMIASAALTAVMLLIILVYSGNFLTVQSPRNVFQYVACILGTLLTGILAGFQYLVPEKTEKWLTRLAIVLLPVGTIAMAECFSGVIITRWHILVWLYNCVFYSVLYLLVFAITGSRRAPFLVINTLVYILALVNHYVLAYRGSPFLPVDLLYVETAASVAGSYGLELNHQVITGTVLYLFMLAVSMKIKTHPQKLWKKIYYRAVAGVAAFVVLGSYFTTDAFVNLGIKPYFYDQISGYRSFGVTLSFFMNTRYLSVEKPKNYDPTEIEDLVYGLVDDNNDSGTAEENTNKSPNIICIMNETLSDLSVLGELNTNKDYMPFLRSLTENTVKGNLYVPVIGGGTSNSEFEFLTGVSTAFFPAGSNAYASYINRETNNLTATLKLQSYATMAFHPFYKENWNRVEVYKNLGFDQYIGFEDIEEREEVLRQDEGIFIREYISDTYDYKTVIEMYENKKHEEPLFIFNVTMQNHGGYTDSYENFKEEIYLVDENGNPDESYPKANQYLSLIYESDKAIESLVAYFSQQEEPTIICIFGDHQPTIENEFIAEVMGVDDLYGLSPEQTQARYCTPFYIWANYDIDEKEIDKLSANYLASYVMQISGVDMPLFNQYLIKLSEVLPVIDTVGYIDKENNYYVHDQQSEYSSLISDYEKICYNIIFDEENLCTSLYQTEQNSHP